jgi:hypothetical protein
MIFSKTVLISAEAKWDIAFLAPDLGFELFAAMAFMTRHIFPMLRPMIDAIQSSFVRYVVNDLPFCIDAEGRERISHIPDKLFEI